MSRTNIFVAPPTVDARPEQRSKHWPGIATRHKDGSIQLVKGTVIYVSKSVQAVEPQAKFFGFKTGSLQHLLGQSYAFMCPHCRTSVCAGILPSLEAISKATGMGLVEATAYPRCPYCYGKLVTLQPGDKVLLHHRYELPRANPDTGEMVKPGWATWFAQKWEW